MKNLSLTCACVAVLEATAAGPSQAQSTEEAPGPVLTWHVGAGVAHDSNILRAATAVSDDIGILTASVQVDKRYSLQRLTLQAQAHRYQFRDFSNLDYSTLTYAGAWHFQFTPRLQGVLSADRRQNRDITNVTLASDRLFLRTDRQEQAEVTLLGRGGWRTLAGLTHTRSRSDDPRSLEASPTVSSVHVGGGYEFPSGTQLTARMRRGDGDYGGAASAIGFRETEPSVSITWPLTVKSRLDARIGYLDREHHAQPARDFKGFVSQASARWEYSPRTALTVGWARDLGSYELGSGGRIRSGRLFLEPSWKPSEKTALTLRHTRESRHWQTVSLTAPDWGREDRTRGNAITLEWMPRRLLSVTLTASQERRRSNLPALDYRANVLRLDARLNF